MPRILLTFALLCLAASPALAKPERYEFDKSHSRIMFFISHSEFSNMVGEFRDYGGHFMLDEKHPENTEVEVEVKIAGVDTRDEKLNDHLKNEDFFNIEKFPTATFKSTKVERTGEESAKLTGDFTLLGVTKPVTFDVVLNKIGEHPISKNTIAGFSAQGILKRSDFGMNYGLPDIIGDEVRIHLEIEGINMDRLPGKKEHP